MLSLQLQTEAPVESQNSTGSEEGRYSPSLLGGSEPEGIATGIFLSFRYLGSMMHVDRLKIAFSVSVL